MEMERYYTDLANAVVVQAAFDYMQLKKNNTKALYIDNMCITMSEILNFFDSKWYARLTVLDSGYLIRLLNKNCEKGKFKPKYLVHK